MHFVLFRLWITKFIKISFHIFYLFYSTYIYLLARLHNAQDQLVHLKHEEDELNRALDEDEAQINKITELISVVEM